MIDIENVVFNNIAKSLRTSYPGIFVNSEKIAAPPSYPCVSIVEADNFAYTRTQDSSQGENHASVMYEVQVFSNKTNGKKSECKAIFATIDSKFNDMGFTRKTRQPIPMDDAKSYQLIGRYEAIVSKNQKIYRR